MSTKDIIINRDLENDILYVIKEGVDKANTINISHNADILLRIDPATRKVIGLTVENFSRVSPHLNDDSDYALMEKFDTIIDSINDFKLVRA